MISNKDQLTDDNTIYYSYQYDKDEYAVSYGDATYVY
jgi:hypothetical protein